MTFPIVTFGHPALRRTARPVKPDEITDGSIARIAAWMLTAMRAHDGVGVAAPQLAMNVRIFIAAPKGDHQHAVFINPTVLEDGDNEATGDEGCLSIPGLTARVYRATTLKVEALNLDGEPFTYEAHGFAARIIAHELDHLDGTLICDHLEGDRHKAFLHWHRCTIGGLPQGRFDAEAAPA